MTVRQMIEALQAIEDKNKPVYFADECGYFEIDSVKPCRLLLNTLRGLYRTDDNNEGENVIKGYLVGV